MSIDINIEFTINDILFNKETLKKKNKYVCPICYDFFHKKSIFQCKTGHFACQECWETSLISKNECMICRIKVNSLKDLSRCLVIEQCFAKKECCCIYSFTGEILDDRTVGKKFKRKLIKDEENGCKEILTVEDLDTHIQNCKFKFVKCPNKGCDKKFRLHSFGEHENECTFKLATCEYCKKNDIAKNELNNHNEVCPKVKIDCLQDCQMKIERDEMKNHIENNCDNTIVNCKYHEQGCEITMKRSELQNHLKNINHQFYIGELIDQSNKIINDLKKMLEVGLNPLVYKNKWTISKFSLYPQKIVSPKFTVCSNEFQVIFFPLHPSIYLFRYKTNGNSVKVDISFTIFNVLDNSKSITIHLGEKVFDDSSYGVGDIFLSHHDLINKENGWLSDNDKLTVEINIKVLDQTIGPLES
ncbi:hypothetical protein ACTFIR_002758 [Dictyostelium discoideum]